MIFGQNWTKYQGYSLTFWPELAHFSHFLLYNQNQEKMIFGQNWAKYQGYSLTFGQNWPILATFYSTIQIRKNDFWSKLGKIPRL